MSALEVSLIILLAIALISLLYLGFYLLTIYVLNPSGKGAHKKTTRTLKKYGLIRGFKVLSDVRFTYKGKEHRIENILIGYFGVLIVHTLGGRGEYYGQLDGKEWSRNLDNKKDVFPNPVIAQDEAVAAMRAIFSKSKIFNVPIEPLVVLTNRSNKTKLYITNGNRILLPGKLKPYLDKTKFEKDAGVDVAKIADAIKQAEISVGKN